LLALANRVAPSLNAVGIIDPENTASKKLLERFGFRSYFIGIEDGVSTEKLIYDRTLSMQ